MGLITESSVRTTEVTFRGPFEESALKDFSSERFTVEINISDQNEVRKTLVLMNCSDDIMSVDNLIIVEKTVVCSFMPSMFFIGSPVNVLSMIIFYRQGLRDRMNLCLFCLAFVDLLFGVVIFVTSSPCFVGIFLPDQEQFWNFKLTAHTLNFMYGFAYSSGCLTMIISVERCVCVMFPMKASTLISTKTMAIIVSVTLLLIQALCSVYTVKEKVLPMKDASGNFLAISTNTEMFLSHSAFRIIENIVLSFISFFTFTVVFLTTTLTVVGLRSAMTWRKSTASSHLKGQAVLMRMLVAVSSLYILCSAPNVALALTRFVVPEFRADGRYCNVFLASHVLGNTCVMFNSSINFFVYVTMSSRFRHELHRFCRRCPRYALSG